jgi:hypothetical protein
MYSHQLQEYVQQISEYALVNPSQVHLLEETMACFIGTLGRIMEARSDPEGDLLNVTIRLLLISDGLSRLSENVELEGVHYLVGHGFEQISALTARLTEREMSAEADPIENDIWYGLTLSLLHYLAGGHRVQALSVLRRLESIASTNDNEHITNYRRFAAALRRLYSGREIIETIGGLDNWDNLMLGRSQPHNYQEQRIQQLAHRVRRRRDVVLTSLGEGKEEQWLSNRNISRQNADFWKDYLAGLDRRGVTTFTHEQVGEKGFDDWLQPSDDLLVVLPTGSGKTIIGELRTALTLAQNRQVLWLLPTRALVRQTKKTLRDAFEEINVTVEELPTTEDFIPLFVEGFEQSRHIAVSTPWRINALLRARPESIDQVGLVVVDEAQILLDRTRGTAAEFVLQQISNSVPTCNFVLMTAFGELKDALEQFITRLFGKPPKQLASEVRPTRRIYGIITNEQGDNQKQYPVSLLYPPGLQEEKGTTHRPFRLIFDQGRPLPDRISALDTARRVVQKATLAKLRTAFFVYQVVSTETQAEKLITGQTIVNSLPEQDIERLRIELGRQSIIERTADKGVAPHHAGLTSLEQTLVEKWVSEGIVSTVSATPTLAQGINLPFDFSVVTYTKRYNTGEPLSLREIRNMLGRAGRAGYVSDGVALISVEGRPSSVKALDNSRYYFFRREAPSNEYLGLARLAYSAVNAGVSSANWIVEMGGLSFNEAQSLIHFVRSVTAEAEAPQQELLSQMRRFPSVQGLPEHEMSKALEVLITLNQNLELFLQDEEDPILKEALRRTGMPIEVLLHFLSHIRTDLTILENSSELEQMLWADDVVFDTLATCTNREWYKKLQSDDSPKDIPLEKIRSTISLWRMGSPIVELERNWEQIDQPEENRGTGGFNPSKSTRIDCGRFRRQKLPLFAQFWGALVVCYQVERGLTGNENLKLLLQKLPAFIREGVSSIEQLEWLHAIGGVDRVLAHKLAKVWAEASRSSTSEREIRNTVKKWRNRQQLLPDQLDGKYRRALEGVFGW